MSIVQLIVITVICIVCTAPNGIVLPHPADDWLSVLYMAVFAGAAAMIGQTWAQAHLPPTRAAIIMSMEPVFAALFAVLLGGESATDPDGLRRPAGAGGDADGRARTAAQGRGRGPAPRGLRRTPDGPRSPASRSPTLRHHGRPDRPGARSCGAPRAAVGSAPTAAPRSPRRTRRSSRRTTTPRPASASTPSPTSRPRRVRPGAGGRRARSPAAALPRRGPPAAATRGAGVRRAPAARAGATSAALARGSVSGSARPSGWSWCSSSARSCS